MQNYRYRSPGSTRGCVRQPEFRQDSRMADISCETNHRENCSNADTCREKEDRNECAGQLLERMPLAMAYVPWSRWKNIYEAEKGLQRGTIFQDLDKPFCGIGGCQNVR